MKLKEATKDLTTMEEELSAIHGSGVLNGFKRKLLAPNFKSQLSLVPSWRFCFFMTFLLI